MNILLIYPEFPDTFWSFKHALKFVHKKSAAPPLGLLTIAALLPPDWNKRLVDLNIQALTAKDLAWADYAFISSMTVQRQSAREVAQRCRAAGVKVVGSNANPGVAASRATSCAFIHGAPTSRKGASVPRPSEAFVASRRHVPG